MIRQTLALAPMLGLLMIAGCAPGSTVDQQLTEITGMNKAARCATYDASLAAASLRLDDPTIDEDERAIVRRVIADLHLVMASAACPPAAVAAPDQAG